MSTDVLIVGASAGGLSVAEALRRYGFTGSIRMVGEEPHLPYDRPPLSKQVLSGEWAPERATLRDRDQLAALGLDVMVGYRATAVDVAAHTVRLDGGRGLEYGTLVVATGLTPRRLPGQPALDGVYQLHTLPDSIAMRQALLAAQRVAVVGAGVLGCEVAATARRLGCDVTLIDPAPSAMYQQLGPQLGGLVAGLQTDHGVRVLTGTPVQGMTSALGRVSGVRIDGGAVVPADVVVVTIGAVPATGWLATSGIRIDNGVVCDSRCRAAEDVYAVGDVARWHHQGYGTMMRLENRTNALEQGISVAATITGADRPYSPVPYFWTDQYDVKLQIHGFVPPEASIRIIDGSPEGNKFVALAESGGRTTAAIGWNSARGVRAARQLVVEDLRLATTRR